MIPVDSINSTAADRDRGDSEESGAGSNPAAPTDEAETANLDLFRQAVAGGADWVLAMIDAMARWSSPEGTHRGRRQRYFIAGEAFDWPLLAGRLCSEAGRLIPAAERDDLLLRGNMPARMGDRAIGDLMKERLGVEKYRGYLNYYYGVTVEEAILHAVEEEVRKDNLAKGVRYRTDEADDAIERLYGASREELVASFRSETGTRVSRGISLRQSRELTYWLFGYRVRNSDKAKVASDTKKGLDQLARLAEQARAGRRAGQGKP